MFILGKILSVCLLPPVCFFLAAGLSLIILPKRFLLGLTCLCVALFSWYLFSTPWLKFQLAAHLQAYPRLVLDAQEKPQAIVIVGGGRDSFAPQYGAQTVNKFTLERLRYGARLARRYQLPVLLSGGSLYGGLSEAELMASALKQDFLLDAVMWQERQSRNTRENAQYSAEYLRALGIEKVFLVSHAWHMPRAMAEFSAQGLSVVPAPTGFMSTDTPSWVHLWLPTDAQEVHVLLKEYLGLLLIKLR
jgi:uncharacterized SAM-binding protein YcdF (DUF218 family)